MIDLIRILRINHIDSQFILKSNLVELNFKSSWFNNNDYIYKKNLIWHYHKKMKQESNQETFFFVFAF